MKIRTVFEVLKDGPRTKDYLRVVLTALSVVAMTASLCAEMRWLIESLGWVCYSWTDHYFFMACRVMYAFAIVLFTVLAMRQAEQTYHAYLYYRHTIDACVYATNHGVTPLEVIQGIHGEPVEYLATFTEDGQKVAESTLHCQYEVMHEYDAIPMRAGMTEIHNHPGWSSSSFSSQDVRHAISCSLAASIVVARRYVYRISLTPEHWQMDPRPITKEIEAVLAEMNGEYRFALHLLRLEEIFGRYGIKFEYWPYNLYVAMEKERLNAQKSQPAAATTCAREKP